MSKFNVVKVDGEYKVEEVTGDRIRKGSFDTEVEALEGARLAALGKTVQEWVAGPSLLEQQAFKNADLTEENNNRTKKTFRIKDNK